MTRTRDIEAVLLAMDPAPAGEAAQDDARAGADLRRILATDPHRKAGRRPAPEGWRRFSHLSAGRLVAAGALVVVLAVALIVAPSLGSATPAFASWTASPDAVTSAQARDAARSCRDLMGEDAGAGERSRLREARTVVAEQRGVWTLVLLAGEGGFSATCLTPESTGFFGGGGEIGSVTVSAVAPPGPRGVVATDLSTLFISGAGDLSVGAGLVGDEVSGVSYRSPSGEDVEATVGEGRFVFWLPGDALGAVEDDGADVEVTYRDGTTTTTTLGFR